MLKMFRKIIDVRLVTDEEMTIVKNRFELSDPFKNMLQRKDSVSDHDFGAESMRTVALKVTTIHSLCDILMEVSRNPEIRIESSLKNNMREIA